MSRWDYDTVFYRVFCITLLGVAFTFTVILTNVFVDIDGLLSKKDKGKTNPQNQLQYETRIPGGNEPHVLAEVVHLPDMNSDTSEDVYEDKDYQDSTDLYRSKRSLEPPNLLSKVKDQKVKKILTNHLATLLDELDEEELPINDKNENQDSTNDMKLNKNHNIKLKDSESIEDSEHNEKYSEVERNIQTDENKTKNENLKVQDSTNRIKEVKEKVEKDGASNANQDEGLLHLAMHNVILEGIIGNMNLDDVYRKVADLVKSFENNHSVVISKDEFKNLFKDTKKLHMEDETIFEKLLNQLGSGSTKRNMFMKKRSNVASSIAQLTTTAKPEGHNVMINTVIDITSRNAKTNKESDLNNHILNGSIKLIYNGKSIRFRRVDDVTSTRKPIFFKNSIPKVTEKYGQKTIDKTHRDTDNYTRNSYYKKLINKYLKKMTQESGSSEHDKLLSRKRLKRHIKIRYDHDKKTVTPKTKIDDDELFVEIETHFDSKGAKGEKKKKMIRDLISKIQKAIHSDKESKNKKQRHWHVKKRTQDPLSSRYAATFLNKLSLPYETLAHRHIDPISKSSPIHEDIPLVSDGWGRTHWRQEYVGPRFLSKSINSAEMNTVDIDYNKVMRFNGIPQRLQKPINTDMSEEALQESNVIDLGNIKFLMKDIDGSGFTIGFNQYTDEAPDPESMKLFSGIENIIKTYHQKYDKESPPDTQQESYNDDSNNNNNDDDGNEHQNNEQTEITEQHSIKRRSIKQLHELHHDANEYKTIYRRNFLPFDDQEMYEFNEIYLPKVNKTRKHKKNNKSSLILDENLFEKKLKPAEILSIANLFQRWKRSLSVKKISKVKIKNKINRYLNTKAMATRTMLFNKNRHKRQIDKIRVIARDLPNLHKNLEEDVFIVSDEKLFANRASVRELEVPEIEPSDKMHSSEHYDFISPQKEEDVSGVINQPEKEVEEHYDIVSPFEYEPSIFETHNNEFTRHARHNSLMSKYPHIIMEETSRSKEDMYPEENYEYENILNNIPAKSHNMEISDNGVVLPVLDVHSDNAQEITGLIPSPKDNSNYKVTVKIRPKNGTGMAGYKEIHTSINKSYNKNGLIYTSLVNVSELSKVEKVNQSIKTRRSDLDHQAITNLNHQQQLINSLIQQHKHRIDEQLRLLHIEKEKLESLNIDNKRNLPDAFTETNQKLDETTTTTEASTKVTFAIPIESTTFTVPSTTAYVQSTTQESDKVQIIHTIERNENMTNEILKKIDQNTNVLKIFLGKLLSKIDVSSDKENTEHSTTITNAVKHTHTTGTQIETTNKSEQSNLIINQASPNRVLLNPYDFKTYHQTLPNLFFNNIQGQPNNNTLGIPFVYAIQKPYSMTNNETPITSMVYHGHIHTNMDDKESYYKAVNTKSDYKLASVASDKSDNKDNLRVENTQKPGVIDNKDAVKEFWIANPGEKVLHNFVRQNNSRFFIDELGGNYKVLPLVPKTDFKPLGMTNNLTTV